jgi:hypothetical protein
MKSHYRSERGFTLIATLLLLLLLTGLGLGLMMMTNTETTAGGNDMENSVAYHGAEAGMEKMTVDLATLFQTNQTPSASAIAALAGQPPNLPNINYDQYTLSVQTDSSGKPITHVDNIHQGPNAGLIALIEPITLQVAASLPGGMSVNMIRNVEVALIPVFQFGVFSDSDLSYFPGPSFDFKGRVHTNGNLFLGTGSSNGLIFHSKMSAVGEIVRDYLSNGFAAVGSYPGPVYIPNAPNGCDGGHPAANCLNLHNNPSQGSVTGGMPGAGAVQNPNWVNVSTTTFNGYVINGRTGARPLQLPFVQPGAGPIEVIRKSPANETAGSPVGQSRLYNHAQIRILLADSQQLLHPERSFIDADDVQLINNGLVVNTTGPTVTFNGAHATGPVNVAGIGDTYFAEANLNCGGNNWCEPNDQYRPSYVTGQQWSLLAADQTDATRGAWLRVEYLNNNGNWVGVTREWLRLGFARGPAPPTVPGGNNVHPNAILIFQQQADRDGNGVISDPSVALDNTYADPYDYNNEREAGATISGPGTQSIWFPIMMYDPREGEVRDSTAKTAGTCAPNGIMNVVEIDAGNLRRWLGGVIGTSGSSVNYTNENGYLLFFSDRRGMQPDPNPAPGSIYPANVLTGAYGFEDTINSGSLLGTPDGVLEPNNSGTNLSPEDVDGKGSGLPIDTWGVVNIMDGYAGANANGLKAVAINTARVNRDPYSTRVSCMQVARKNLTAGARHVLRLIDGSLGNLPVRGDNNGGGFSVASENPVYVLGDYNANAGGFDGGNAAAAIMADSVTLLSNNWSDLRSSTSPFNPGGRPASTTWYRMAIAAGKTISFPRPGANYSQDFGTDGGLHNFLRYIENWGGQTLNYQGSLVSLFYSQYATGTFKCCSTVYSPPTRAYSFDQMFLNPANLPPGTPMFEDINNLSYRQDFTAR